MPNLPPEISTDIDIERNGIVDLLLMSIALEELSLSHIVNAEGEMMQLFLDTAKKEKHFKKEELIKLNRSVSDTLRIVLEKEKTLKEKLIQIIHFHQDSYYYD